MTVLLDCQSTEESRTIPHNHFAQLGKSYMPCAKNPHHLGPELFKKA
jgi:hypothetical protein